MHVEYTEKAWLNTCSEMADIKLERLREHSATFAAMVELLPAQLYLSKEAEEEEDADTQAGSKYWINKKKHKAPRQSVKDATKKAKRLKFDPESQKSISQQQAERAGRQQREDSVGEGELSGDEPTEQRRRKPFSVEKVKSASLGELQLKLKEKIEVLRQKRKLPDTLASTEVAEKRSKRSEKKQQKKKLRAKQKAKKIASKPNEVNKPSIEDESGKLVFSKFDFSTQQAKEYNGEGKKKNYKRLLAKAEATQKKLEQLKKKDERKSEELHEKLQWQRAVDLAKGVKRKDDPKFLKQTMKRIEKRKGKSRKSWEDRATHEKETKDKKQEVRRKHIKERADHIKTAKMKKMAKKRGLTRKPGF